MTSKTLFVALGLAALVATPALAQKHVRHSYASGPYASAATSTPVVEDNRVVGTDPDPAIRSELARDWATSQGTN